MRIAALYDIHGNRPALDAVLGEVRAARVDRVVIGGDVIPGPMPLESFEALAALDVPVDCIYGNGEHAVIEQLAGVDTTLVPAGVLPAIRWVASRLPADVAAMIRTWPLTLRIAHPVHGDILFCHATPRNDTELFTRRTPKSVLLPIFDAADANIVVCGHTHMQVDRRVGRTRVLNAGSVGMPFGASGAYWLLVSDQICELRRTSYDLERAAALIRGSEYPGAEAFASVNVLSPPPEETILDSWRGKTL